MSRNVASPAKPSQAWCNSFIFLVYVPNVPKCVQMSPNVAKRRKMLQNIQKHHIMLQNVAKCPKALQNVQKRPETSKNVPKHTKTSAMPTQAQLSMMQYCIILRTSWKLFENSDAINSFYCILLQNVLKRPETSKNIQKHQQCPPKPSKAWCNSLFSLHHPLSKCKPRPRPAKANQGQPSLLVLLHHP